MQWINYHHLYYFYVIASEGGVTEATSTLKLAQSTLSAQLKQFEDVIGYKLFERKHRRLILTDVGQKVFEYAHEIFSLGSELRVSLKSFEDSLRVSLKVGVVDSVPKQISKDLFAKVYGHNSNVQVTFFEESLNSLCARLEEHEIDIILANDKPPKEGKRSQFHAKLIGELKVVFVTRSDRFLLKEDLPRSLDQQPVIMPSEKSPLHAEIMEHFRVKHIHPKIVAEVDDIELQKMLILEGYGFAALPIASVAAELNAGEMIRLSETPICHESLWLITGHRLVHNPVAKELLESFRPK